MTHKERVERGAAVLDQALPGWEQAVDLDTLNLQNALSCVLGQVFGNYYTARSKARWSIEDAVDLGFSESTLDDADWSKLQRTWEKKIKERKKVLVDA